MQIYYCSIVLCTWKQQWTFDSKLSGSAVAWLHVYLKMCAFFVYHCNLASVCLSVFVLCGFSSVGTREYWEQQVVVQKNKNKNLVLFIPLEHQKLKKALVHQRSITDFHLNIQRGLQTDFLLTSDNQGLSSCGDMYRTWLAHQIYPANKVAPGH